MKKGYTLVLLGLVWLVFGKTLGQTPVRFSKLPAAFQLFPRNAQNTATVPVEGLVTAPGYERISVQVLRNATLTQAFSQPLRYEASSGQAAFAFAPSIRAELAEYGFRVYLHRTGDSLRVAARDSVVAGDAYFINGQSNAFAFNNWEYDLENRSRNEFCRTYYVVEYNGARPVRASWELANTNAVVGVWGTQLQRLIAQNYGIPTCLINEADGGQPIRFFTQRLPDDTLTLSTNYAHALNRIKNAGLQSAIRAVFWRQGENESAQGQEPNVLTYPAYFSDLYGAWKKDFPSLKHVYVFQNNIYQSPSQRAGELRDYQRRTAQLFPDVTALATVGYAGFDGIHYAAPGHVQAATELFPLVARHFYGSTDTLGIESPRPRKVYFESEKNDWLSLDFGDEMTFTPDLLVPSVLNGWPEPLQLKTYFFPDSKTDQIDSVQAVGTRIRVHLRQPGAVSTLSYLPSYNTDPHVPIFIGPYLKNKRGRAALSFQNVAVAKALASPRLAVQRVGYDSVRLAWTLPTEATVTTSQRLERSDDGGRTFTTLATLSGSARLFADGQNLRQGTRYVYRLRGLSANAESRTDTIGATTARLRVLTLTADAQLLNRVRLAWTTPSGLPDFTQSLLERATLPDTTFSVVARVKFPATTYTDSLVVPNTTYVYRLRTISGSATSAPLQAQTRTLVLTALADEPGDFAVFPNPVRTQLTVRLPRPQATTLRLFDQTGRILAQKQSTAATLTLDCAQLPAGLYLLRVETPDAILTRKVLVE